MSKNEFNQEIGEFVAWSPIPTPTKKLLQGNYCILEQLDLKQHAAALFEAISMDNQGESWTYLPYGPFNTYAEFVAGMEKIISDNDTVLYAILDLAYRPIGVAGYLRINPSHGVIEVGHVHFSKLLKRTPAATEAIYLLMHYIFEELGYRRFEWKCHSLNFPSRKAALRFGFKFEGTFRQSNVFKNHNRDTDWFSIIDKEWPGIKEKFQQWLNANNFDDGGNQKFKLQAQES